MKHILMRAYMSPFRNPGYYEAILNNLMGTNIGNLVFTHSITRTLMLPDTAIDFDNCYHLDDEKIERINQEYDAFVIPLANAMRRGFIPSLNRLTHAVRRLDIPCIVIGVGYQADIQDDYSFHHKWNKQVKWFCNAVLKKSALIGVRGETTARYLEHLGYERNKHFTVIGCPSMYLYGPDLPHPKPLDLSHPLRVNLNGKSTLGEGPYRLIEQAAGQAGRYFYIPQNTYELTMMYSGMPMEQLGMQTRVNAPWPESLKHPFYKGGHGRGFVTVEAWRRFLSQGDLNFGTRIHGNIMGVLAGVPTFIAAPDSRVLELAEYHNIPHAPVEDINPSFRLEELLGGIDFDHVLDEHDQRFAHYLDFLHANGLETIFDEPLDRAPFDERMASIDFRGPFKALNKSIDPVQHAYAARLRKKIREKEDA